MESVSINEIAQKRLLEKSDPSQLESIILGTLVVVEDPTPLFDFLKSRISSKMFSDANRPMAELIFDMLDTREHLRHYNIIAHGEQKGLFITKEDISTLRYQSAERVEDFEDICLSFINKWYTLALNKSGLIYVQDISASVDPIEAYNQLEMRNAEIIDLKSGLKQKDYSVYAAAADYVDLVEKRKNNPSLITGSKTGIRRFDSWLGGLQEGEMSAACGKGGRGKTTLVFQMAENIAKTEPVDFYSLEVSRAKLSTKSLSLQTGVSSIKMTLGNVSEQQLGDLKKSLILIAESKLSIIDDIFSIDELERSITMRVKKFGVTCVYIDNLTIIDHSYKMGRDDAETKITYRLKRLAAKLKIHITVLVHQTVMDETRADKVPTTTDMKFAGKGVAFDIVYWPYTTKADEEESSGGNEVKTAIVITKNRSTDMTGIIPLVFVKNYGMYCEEGDDGRAILPHQAAKSEITEANKIHSNIITHRGDPNAEIPF